MSKWIYFDYTENKKVLFECDGSLSILEADKAFQEATQKSAMHSSIGCYNTGWPSYTNNQNNAAHS